MCNGLFNSISSLAGLLRTVLYQHADGDGVRTTAKTKTDLDGFLPTQVIKQSMEEPDHRDNDSSKEGSSVNCKSSGSVLHHVPVGGTADRARE